MNNNEDFFVGVGRFFRRNHYVRTPDLGAEAPRANYFRLYNINILQKSFCASIFYFVFHLHCFVTIVKIICPDYLPENSIACRSIMAIIMFNYSLRNIFLITSIITIIFKTL